MKANVTNSSIPYTHLRRGLTISSRRIPWTFLSHSGKGMKSMESSTEVQEKRLWEEWDGFEFEGLEATAGTKNVVAGDSQWL